MNKLIIIAYSLACCLLFTQCSDYLDTTSPSNADDEFVTSSPSETFKVMSKAYAVYRQNAVMGIYNWNDPLCSDIEYYPEKNSSNNNNARLKPDIMDVDAVKGGFDGLYNVISYASRVAELIAAKDEYKADIAAGVTSDWTQLHGEATALRALCYFDLIRHFGDVPYGYENNYVVDFKLTSRFEIYDALINSLKAVEPYMYKLGEGSITAERLSKTFVDALIAKIALFAGGYQTIRTDIDGLYGTLTFTNVSTDATHKSAYARRADYLPYYTIAKDYLIRATTVNAGTAALVTTDERTYANNPFQRHFQYGLDLEVSPETLFEVGIAQGPSATGMSTNGEYGYAFGRGSSGGNNAAPNKLFAAVRMVPTFYYGGYATDDPRRDVSAVVTGFDGKGNEKLIPFTPNSKADGGGICLNKWDLCRQTPPYTGKQRMAGIDWPIMRYAEVLLMLAEVKAELNEADAIDYLNDVRQRAFGDTNHDLTGLTGEALKEAILMERKFEFFGEGIVRFDLIRSGKFSEKAIAVRNELNTVISNLNTNGFHTFSNGAVFPAYIWTKQVPGAQLTYDCTNVNDSVMFPGWRGVYDFASLGVSVTGTNHNTAIRGLFNYINPTSADAATLESYGYAKKDWGSLLVTNADTYLDNILVGITSATTVPHYFWPIPYEVISQSKGKVTNGYGLPQE